MECAVRLAEINNDTQTNAQEQAQYEAEYDKWMDYVNRLLEEETIEIDGRKYSLDEYVKNKHYKLFKQEARTLASIICGA